MRRREVNVQVHHAGDDHLGRAADPSRITSSDASTGCRRNRCDATIDHLDHLMALAAATGPVEDQPTFDQPRSGVLDNGSAPHAACTPSALIVSIGPSGPPSRPENSTDTFSESRCECSATWFRIACALPGSVAGSPNPDERSIA